MEIVQIKWEELIPKHLRYLKMYCYLYNTLNINADLYCLEMVIIGTELSMAS